MSHVPDFLIQSSLHRQPTFDEIFSIFDKAYQSRSFVQQKKVLRYLQTMLPDRDEKELKMLSFYFQTIQGPLYIGPPKYCQGTLVIMGDEMVTMSDKGIEIQKGLIVLQSQIAKCKMLKGIGLDDELLFLQKSRYFGLVAKKRRLLFMKYSTVLVYSMNQVVVTDQSEVYYVREGHFSLIQHYHNRQIELYENRPDEIIGYLQEERYKCKDSYGIVYKIGKEFFQQNLLYYFEDVLENRMSKKRSVIEKSYEKSKEFMNMRMSFRKQSLSTGLISYRSENNHKMYNTMTKYPSINNIQEQKEDKPVKYLLEQKKYDSVLHKKVKQIEETDKQHKEMLKLYQKKGKCLKMRELTKPTILKTKGEILFSLFKHSWQFERQKRLQKKR